MEPRTEIGDKLQKTKKRYDGQTVYKVTENIGDLKKGDQLYLDGLHKDHLEVFNKRGQLKNVINLDGSSNIDKLNRAGWSEVTMIEEFEKLLEICEQYSEKLGEKQNENEELMDLKESITLYLERDCEKLLSAIELFEPDIIFESRFEEQYNQFYQQVLSSMSDFATYFDDFHEVIFRLNKKRNLLKGLISVDEYEASDTLNK